MSEADPLFSSLEIGNATSRNRILCLPHGVPFLEHGLPNAEFTEYVRRVAKGSAGVFVLGSTAVHESSWLHQRHMRLFDPKVVPGLGRLCDAAHQEDSLFICQLGHLGRGMNSWRPYFPAWAPSPTPSPAYRDVPHAMTKRDIAELRQHYELTTGHALQAGADGVEVHAAQGYLLHQFLSSWSNARTDEYGGSLENRMRLLCQVLEDVRAAASSKIVGLKISAGEGFANGLTWRDVQHVVAHLSRLELFDYVTLCVPQLLNHNFMRDGAFAPGGLRTYSRELKQLISQVVVVSQRIDRPEVGRDILLSGDADMVGMARALLADPAWGEKARLRRESDIRPCIACLQDCREGTQGEGFGCAVNPALRPSDERTPRASRRLSKAVVVVGGGPAGCMAALASAEAGAHVVLFEEGTRLGGRVLQAGAMPHRHEWSRYAAYLTSAVSANRHIDLHLGSKAGADDLLSLDAAVVVVAVGADVCELDFELDVPVFSFEASEQVGESVGEILVVDVSGGWEAIGVAETWALRGRSVRYIARAERLGDRVPQESRDVLETRFSDVGIRAYLSAAMSRRDGHVDIVSGDRVQASLAARDVAGVIVAARYEPRTELAASLGSLGVTTFSVGDCLSPRGLGRAVKEGSLAPAWCGL